MISLAVMMDFIIGDPYGWPHPIIFIGKLIAWIDERLDKRTKFEGFFLWASVLATSGLLAFGIEKALHLLPLPLGFILLSFCLSTMLSTKCLADEAKKVMALLEVNDIENARIQIGYLVGRDTRALDKEAITKACIETIAENTIDGSIAPLFYMIIGQVFFGLPLTFAVMYKAINTLDSMVGYKNDRHANVGYVSAKVDDLANLLPARLGSLLMIIAGSVFRLDGRRACSVWLRDRYKHKSPNAGFPESVISGLLGIQLGGSHIYFGKRVEKPTIGDAVKAVEVSMIEKTNRVLYATMGIALMLKPLFIGGIL